MRTVLIVLLIAIYTADAGTLRDDPNVASIQNEIFNETSVVYRGNHEIVKIYAPLFLIENNQMSSDAIFFIEADIGKYESKTYKGLYVKIDEDNIIRLLSNGRDVDGDANGNVYFAASDGIYKYNAKEKTAEKYGSLNESITYLAVENNTGIIHALSENSVLYTITINGTKADVNDKVKNAHEIATDLHDDSLYYYDVDKVSYVLNKDGTIRKIEGLPANPTYIKIVRGPLQTQGMIYIVNNMNVYLASSNGTSAVMYDSNTTIKLFKPTAYSLDAGVILYFGHDKKIYMYNLIAKFIEKLFQDLSTKFTEWLNKNIKL